MVLFPLLLGSGHPKILKETASKGHEVGVHAWSHIKWGNALEEIEPAAELERMVTSYQKIFGTVPLGFAPPKFRMDDRVTAALEEFGFTYVSSEFGDKPKIGRLLELPLSFPRTIEEAGVTEFRDACRGKGYRAVYIHADWEGRNIDLTRKALEGIQFVPFADLVNRVKAPR